MIYVVRECGAMMGVVGKGLKVTSGLVKLVTVMSKCFGYGLASSIIIDNYTGKVKVGIYWVVS